MPDDVKACFNRVDDYERKGEYDLAIADYDEVIRIEPDNEWVYYLRESIYSFKEEFDLAITDFTEVIRIRPYYAKAYQHRADAYAQKGDDISAEADRQKFKELMENRT